MRLTID
jgi:hypothetical protein